MGCNLPLEREQEWQDVVLNIARTSDDEHLYDNMEEFEWDSLLQAVQERHTGTVFWTTLPQKVLEKGLQEHDLPYISYYASPTHLNFCNNGNFQRICRRQSGRDNLVLRNPFAIR